MEEDEIQGPQFPTKDVVMPSNGGGQLSGEYKHSVKNLIREESKTVQDRFSKLEQLILRLIG